MKSPFLNQSNATYFDSNFGIINWNWQQLGLNPIKFLRKNHVVNQNIKGRTRILCIHETALTDIGTNWGTLY